MVYDENMDTSKMTVDEFKKWQAAMRARRRRQKLKTLQEKRLGYFTVSSQTLLLLNTRCNL